MRFESFVSFIEIYATRIATEGIFLVTDTSYPAGTEVELDLKLTDGFPVITGHGTVLWQQLEGSPLGMAVRFVDLDEGCQDLVHRIVEQSSTEGVELFDLERLRPSGAASPVEKSSTMGNIAPTEAPSEGHSVAETNSEPKTSFDALSDLEQPAQPGFFEQVELESRQDTELHEPLLPPEPPAEQNISEVLLPIEGARSNKGPQDDQVGSEQSSLDIFEQLKLEAQRDIELHQPLIPVEPPAETSSDELSTAAEPEEERVVSEAPQPPEPSAPVPKIDIFEQLRLEAQQDIEKHEPLIPGAAAPQVRPQLQAPGPTKRASPPFLAIIIIVAAIGGLTFALRERLVAWRVSAPEIIDETVLDIPPAGEPREFPSVPIAVQEPSEGAAAPEALREETKLVTDRDPPDVAEPVRDEPLRDAVAPLTKVRMITWDHVSNGIEVTLWGDGDFVRDNCQSFRFGGDQPRELVKISGIELPFREPLSDLDSPIISSIRTGFHPRVEGSELHVVLDLNDPDAELLQLDVEGNQLSLLIGRAPLDSSEAVNVDSTTRPEPNR